MAFWRKVGLLVGIRICNDVVFGAHCFGAPCELAGENVLALAFANRLEPGEAGRSGPNAGAGWCPGGAQFGPQPCQYAGESLVLTITYRGPRTEIGPEAQSLISA